MNTLNFDQVLTIGAGGQIGSYIDFGLTPNKEELNILDKEAVLRYVQEHKPTTIIHLAAATNMKQTEHDPVYAYELNVQGTYNVALAAAEAQIPMVYLSTSRVFLGDSEEPYTEEITPSPTTCYGRTKYIGEMIVSDIVPSSIIVRTSWVFGGGPTKDNKFYGTVLSKLQKGESEFAGLNDVYGSATYGKDLVQTIKELLTAKTSGIFHVANDGVATRYDLIRAMAEQVNPEATVKSVGRSHFPDSNLLPTNESIVSKTIHLRPWQDALSEYISTEWA